jgi:hypothetical protein
MQIVSKQLIGKHASPVMGLVLEKMFSARSMRSGYKKENWSNHFN